MPSAEDIAHQQELLDTNRRNVQLYLRQQDTVGSSHVSPGVVNGLREACENIHRIKNTLRNWGVTVDDHPDDEAPPLTRSAALAEAYSNSARSGDQVAGGDSIQVKNARDVNITSSQKFPTGGVLLAITLLIILLLVVSYLGHVPPAP